MAQSTGEPVAEGPGPYTVDVAATEVHLLPFAIRMNKLARLLEVSVDDPLFQPLHDQRFALGDHDYARALRPDRRWSVRKIGIWIRGLLPICGSQRFKDLYPGVADAPDAFILRAYGRPVDELDRMALAEVVEGELDRDTAVCVATLSSLEFVTQ